MNRKLLFYGAFTFMLCIPSNSVAAEVNTFSITQQKKQITGTVVDSEGIPIIGANISVKREQQMEQLPILTVDLLYRYHQAVKSPFQFLGYNTQTMKVRTTTNLHIILTEDTQILNEVVVVGYGSQKKANLSGSVSAVNFDEIVQVPVSNTSTMLQGRMPGVTIISGGGTTGEKTDPTINIRGIGTLGNTNPMVIIDGMESSLSNVAPNDIESVTVLKDAASASIYGVRAANGVILVTTKMREEGKRLSVSYAGNFGIAAGYRSTRLLQLMGLG